MHAGCDGVALGFRLTLILVGVAATTAQPYRQPAQQQRCSNRLENALEHLRRRSAQVKVAASGRALQETPYTLYQALYGQRSEDYDDFYEGGGGGGDSRGYYAKNIDRRSWQRRPYGTDGGSDYYAAAMDETDRGHRQPHKLSVARVDVEDLRVKVPPGKSAGRWVEVDKCKFSTENSTLDTRLIFPDLTISGKVVLQPTGGRCNMILRLRRAGIEFHTIPLGFDQQQQPYDGDGQSRRGVVGAASVRTDSHFAEPGFISVFAHACQGPTGIRLRQNSKRRYGYGNGVAAAPQVELSEPHVVLGSAADSGTKRWGKLQHHTYDHRRPATPPFYDIRSESYLAATGKQPPAQYADDRADTFYENAAPYRRYRRSAASARPDQMHFDDDILNFADDELQAVVQPDARAFANIFSGGAGDGAASSGSGADRDEVDDAFTGELERLFSMGVRSLLTTYMQRALQPAIKETLMENMGYTLSYG